MKIGPPDPKPTPLAVAMERKPAAGTAAGGSAIGKPELASQASPGTKVQLGATAALGIEPDGEGAFDAAKVERISQAIRDGTLRIDAGAIADRLIANAQELLDRRQG